MSRATTYKTKMKRRREGRTDYGKRLDLLKSEKSRIIIRISNNNVVAQIAKYDKIGDQMQVNTTSLELKKYGYKGHTGNVCAAYLTGLLCGKKAVDRGIKEAIPDIGLHTPVDGSNVFAVIKGAVDAGLVVPHSKTKLPSDDRVMGKSIGEFRKTDLKIDDVKKKILSEKHGKV